MAKKFYLNTQIIFGGILFTLIVLTSFQAQLLTNADPFGIDLGAIRQAPSLAHPFGTDGVGRDVLTRIAHGGGLSLQIAGIGMIGSLFVGSIAGLLAVFAPKPIRWSVERAIDIQLAFPYVLLAIAITSAVRPSVNILIILMVLAGWAASARVVRSIALQERGKDYVKAAAVLGIPTIRMVMLHVFPTIWPSVVVLAAMQMAAMIVFESTLSFLGMGIQPPTPSWGGIMLDGKNFITSAWWLTTIPGLAIVLTSLSLILIGEGLQKRSLFLRSKESDS
ncbi:MAG: ABC transporter permease [Planktomarina sp.]|nr:ABC transporter permease [Planktomarina sp.]